MGDRTLLDLTEDRLGDAQALFSVGRYSGAYYMAGYSAECALKVCVIKRIEATVTLGLMPEKTVVTGAFTHNLKSLVTLADLGTDLSSDLNASNTFRANWNTTSTWNEAARYQEWSQQDAQDILDALTDPTDGVLQWIKKFW